MALRLLQLLLGLELELALGLGARGGEGAAPLAELRSQLSGVESLLEEFRLQLQPGPGPGRGSEGCRGSSFSARPDAIIRTKDSLAAGATFLRAPAAAGPGWRPCLEACCAEPRCTLAVVQRGAGAGAVAGAGLRCYLFDCTSRGRAVCQFAPHRGYSSYSLGAPGRNRTQRPPQPGKGEPRRAGPGRGPRCSAAEPRAAAAAGAGRVAAGAALPAGSQEQAGGRAGGLHLAQPQRLCGWAGGRSTRVTGCI